MHIMSLMVNSWAEGAVPRVVIIPGELYAATEADAKGVALVL